MITRKKTANAVGGKTARACDSCIRKRARWYCAADDAFLCQSCDSSVHSANQLAGRHERVLLETMSSKLIGLGVGSPEPTWHQGLTRRARTPRTHSKYSIKVQGKTDVGNFSVPLVPEIGVLETSLFDDEEETSLYRVPVFETCNLDDVQGFDLPTDDLDLMEFAADVENLLGFDDTSCGIDDLKLTNDYKEEDDTNNIIGVCIEENRVKVEEILGFDLDANTETLDWDFGYEPTTMIEEDEKKVVLDVEEERLMMVSSDLCHEGEVKSSSLILRLNYEDVISTWAHQGSPWTNGTRPQLNVDGSWPDSMGFQWTGNNNTFGGVRGSDGGREARVSRYKEKRRRRLFSKKIRYEVRKLNAEKRPRMKGRFVKRQTFEEPHATSTLPTYLIKN